MELVGGGLDRQIIVTDPRFTPAEAVATINHQSAPQQLSADAG
jgi:hypothetical protein